ncbi:MAG TPA: hypothetical protein VEG60_06880 [Candidatus Binatia bacterium]|nr:hypothetical protein [Candidatus Binatia bacterium]
MDRIKVILRHLAQSLLSWQLQAVNRAMDTGQIIVPLRGSDRVELFLPYVEQIIQPEMKVVFLVPLRLSRIRELTGQLLAIHAGIRPAYLPEGICEEDIVKNRKESAEQQLNSACFGLRERGVKFEVQVYGGPLQRIVLDYLKKESVHLIMMRPSRSRVMGVLHRLGSIFRLLKPPVVSPVILLHPSAVAER